MLYLLLLHNRNELEDQSKQNFLIYLFIQAESPSFTAQEVMLGAENRDHFPLASR